MTATPEQMAIIAHPAGRHGRVIAGPGTGKSWTAVGLLHRVHAEEPNRRLGLLTFTRAATTELATKVGDKSLDWLNPSTIHAFALRLLLRNINVAVLPAPLRIPDSWESNNLLRPDVARRIRERGFRRVSAVDVARLEQEMAAGWESITPGLVLLSDVKPALRNAYVGAWANHRCLFGYTLLAELPTRAATLLEDHDPDCDDLSFLVVDEYQDLNKSEIRLIELMAGRGVAVLAIGDDDQSIYGFRMAAPEGIRNFLLTFPSAVDHRLTVSMRCGSAIVDAATTLIETAPDRLKRPALTARPGAIRGEYRYLRFPSDIAEASGVARILAHLKASGVADRDLLVLVRSQIDSWIRLLTPVLSEHGVTLSDASWVEEVLAEPAVRRGLATARIAIDPGDSLAWWTLMRLTSGISDPFIQWVSAEALPNESFAGALMRMNPEFAGMPAAPSAKRTARLITDRLSAVALLDTSSAPSGEGGWGSWMLGLPDAEGYSERARKLIEMVGRALPVDRGLGGFLGQIEPIGKDLAVGAGDGVRIMTMAASKGLTVNTVVVLGVEDGIVPHPKAAADEERRLLYVAMTRATHKTILTFAKSRRGPTAHHGAPNVGRSRGRCLLLDSLPIGRWLDGIAYVDALT